MYPTRILRAYGHNGQPPNITGFDMNKFRKAAGPARYDPWENNEAWRYRGQFTRWNRFKGTFPGFGIAAVAFAAYCGYEYFFLGGSDVGPHGEGRHGEAA